jgi:glycosyltransferase involved in cell wall biosynthesis
MNYLVEAVNSIISQTYKNFQLIIVDDASDNKEIKDYLKAIQHTDKRIEVINNAENMGLTKSLNIGLRECKGEYIARMDSDDIALSNRLVEQVKYLKEHQDVALVGSGVIYLSNNTEIIKSRNVLNDFRYEVCSLIQHSGPAHPTFMFRSSFLIDNNIKYPEMIKKAQDYGIMTEILKKGGKIRQLDEALLKYRIHDGQITYSHEREQKIYQLKVSYEYIKALFPELKNEECMSISLLGCPIPLDEIVQELHQNEELNCNCGFDLQLFYLLTNAQIYIKAQKKLFKFNKTRKLFNQAALQDEIGFRWWALSIRNGLKDKRHWGLGFYTLTCLRFSIKRKLVRES